jgi:hypothetical protein
MPMLKPTDHPFEKHDERKVRDIFEDGRLKARFGHDRTECPHDGLPSRREHDGTLSRRKLFRKVWLAGFDLEIKLMLEEAEAARAPVVNDVPIRWNESNNLKKRYGVKKSATEIIQDAQRALQRKGDELPSLEDLEALAAKRLKGAGAK